MGIRHATQTVLPDDGTSAVSANEWNADHVVVGALLLAQAPIADLDAATKLYVDTADALRAPINNAALTGVPTAPTAGVAVNNTQIATTAFVKSLGLPDPGGGGRELRGQVRRRHVGRSGAAGRSEGNLEATPKQYVDNGLALKAPLASPSLTGTPLAPTAAAATNTTQIATTAFVKSLAYAPLADPALTGTPTAPTAAVGVNSTQIATTAFVKSLAYAPLASPTFTGKVITAAPVTGSSGFNLPHGTAPTTLANGDLWTTTAGLYARINGATVGPYNAGTVVAAASISDAAPGSPVAGQMWWQSSTGNLFIYFNDGTSSQWVQVNNTGVF